MTITKQDLILHLEEVAKFDKFTARKFVVDLLDLISYSLQDNQQVKFPGFGTFIVRFKNSRPGRNPRTGEDFEVKSRYVVNFKPSKKLRDALHFGV